MSRNQQEEEVELFVWTIFFSMKAHFLSRETVVREGMSACEIQAKKITLQSDGARKDECVAVAHYICEWSEFG